MDDFFADAAEGKLPPVVYLDAELHADGQPRRGGRASAGERPRRAALHEPHRRRALQEPAMGKLAFFMMYDEHGGIYDHVPPPKACAPDDEAADRPERRPSSPARFDRYGMRVPFLVVSPYAKRGYVSHGVYDHTSILRFIQAKHRLPALTARDANAAVPDRLLRLPEPAQPRHSGSPGGRGRRRREAVLRRRRSRSERTLRG